MDKDCLTIGLAQISPIWLDKEATLEKVMAMTDEAGTAGCHVVCFGEAVLPGYPFWVEHSNGAKFNSKLQKQMFSIYMRQAVCIEEGDLDPLRTLVMKYNMAVIIGIVERPKDRGGHSLYCSRVYIHPEGRLGSVHRKLMPTYEERLVWSIGDGHGLQVHPLGRFSVGALNCWENWMPLARNALTTLGEDLHFALWPGSIRNTCDITRFIALESRSYVISVSGLLKKNQIPESLPVYDIMMENAPDILANGGSCAAAPDGKWILEPVQEKETLLTVKIRHEMILEERQNFDSVGHYARPDVLKLLINPVRQKNAEFNQDLEK